MGGRLLSQGAGARVLGPGAIGMPAANLLGSAGAPGAGADGAGSARNVDGGRRLCAARAARTLSIAAVVAWLSLGGTAWSQLLPAPIQPGRIEQPLQPQPTVPPTGGAPGTPTIPGGGEAPAGAENMHFVLRGLQVSGISVYPAGTFDSFYSGLVGKDVTLAQVYSVAQLSGGSNTNVSIVTQSGIIGLYGIWDLHQPVTTLDTTNGAPVRTAPGNDINAGGFSSTGSFEANSIFIDAGLLGNVSLFGPSGVPTPAVPGVFGPGPFSAVLKQPEEFRLGPVTIYGDNITFGIDPNPDHYDPDHAFHAGDVTVFAEGEVIGSIDVDALHFFGSSANMWGFVDGQGGIGAAEAIDVVQENPPGPFLMNGFPFPVNFLGVQFGIDAILELLDKNLPDGGLPNSGLGSITQADGVHYGVDNYEPYNVEFCRASFNLSYGQGWPQNPAYNDVRAWLIHQGGTSDPCFPSAQRQQQ